MGTNRAFKLEEKHSKNQWLETEARQIQTGNKAQNPDSDGNLPLDPREAVDL